MTLFDVVNFSYGVGIVLAGWVAGSAVFSIFL